MPKRFMQQCATSFSTASTSSIAPGSVSNRFLRGIFTAIWALPQIGIVLYSSSWWVQHFSEKRQSHYSCCRCWVLRLADRWSLLILSKNPRPSMSILTPPQLSIQIWYALERTPTKITTASMFSNSIPP